MIFVYGTLKQGFPNTHLNAGVRQPGRFRTVERLPLYLLGDGHVPCLVLEPGNGHQVIGEVYDVTDETLAVMDRLERLGEPEGYLRIAIEVQAVDADRPPSLTVLVYARQPQQVAALTRQGGPLSEYTSEHTTRFNW
jgi:gamma-glutamylaminecyclotransferase